MNCLDCVNSEYLYDCVNCKNCYQCYNLRNKQYCIRNKQLSKEDYEQEHAVLKKISSKTQFNEFFTQKSHHVHIACDLNGSEKCSGDFLFNSKNTKNSFYSRSLHDSAYVCFFQNSSDNYDCYSW